MSLPTCVIYNPTAGRGRAGRLRTTLEARCPPGTVFRPTAGPRHAEELAADAVRAGFARVVAAGGDGTVHEVANGLIRTAAPGVRFAVLPIGSMNDYAYTLGIGDWWANGRGWDALTPMTVDVGRVRAGDRERFAVNGCGLGFNGLVTVEARGIRRLRGRLLYGLAVLKALGKHFDPRPLTVTRDDETETRPTLALSLNLGQREGGFALTPAAELDDGRFEVLHVGRVRWWELIRHFPGMISGHLPAGHPELRFGRCRTAAVTADHPLCVHVDGEVLCEPADGRTTFTAEVLSGRLTVEMYPPGLYGGRR